MLGDHASVVRNLQATPMSTDFDRLSNQGEGHRVPIRFEADQIVVGHEPRVAGIVLEPRLPARRDKQVLLLDKAINRPLVGRAMHADIGDGRHPSRELLREILIVAESPAGEKIGPGSVGLAEPRLEAPVLGERFEGPIPMRPPLRVGLTDRTGRS
jgi:hypothetical protein